MTKLSPTCPGRLIPARTMRRFLSSISGSVTGLSMVRPVVLRGTNTIEKAERGCVLIENWKNTAGGTGMSINYVDKITGEWVQVWNAEGGSQINIRGGMTDDGMLLVGTLHTVGTGTTIPFRALWTALPDGRVWKRLSPTILMLLNARFSELTIK